MTRGTPVTIGPLTVRTGALEVAAFLEALGLPETCGAVPLTFPMRWLSLPEVRPPLARTLGVEDALVVQQSQSFRYVAPLELDTEYRYEIAARRDSLSVDRIGLNVTVRGDNGEPVLHADTVLRVLERLPGMAARQAPPISGGDVPEIRMGPVDEGRTRRYAAASLDYNPVHLDIDAARAAGLAGPIVHGMLIASQCERVLVSWRRDLRVIRFAASMVQPLLVGESVIAGGRIVQSIREGNVDRVVFRLIVRDERNNLVGTGDAEVLAPRAPLHAIGGATTG